MGHLKRISFTMILAGLITLSGCTLVATAIGPFVGMYVEGKEYASLVQDSRYNFVEKVGVTLALPVSIVSGAAYGAIVAPFVGVGMDYEYITTGEINSERFQEKFTDNSDKYKATEKKDEQKKDEQKK